MRLLIPSTSRQYYLNDSDIPLVASLAATLVASGRFDLFNAAVLGAIEILKESGTQVALANAEAFNAHAAWCSRANVTNHEGHL